MRKGQALLPALVMLAGLSIAAGIGTDVPTVAFTREVVIRGTVYGTDGAPLSGANVFLVGTARGAASNNEGRYLFRASFDDSTTTGILSVQRIGMVEARDTINVMRDTVVADFVLHSQALRLDGIVTTGTVDPTSGAKLPVTVLKRESRAQGSPPANAAAGGRGGGGGRGGVNIALRVPRSAAEVASAPAFCTDPQQCGWNTESYDRIVDNPFLAVGANPLSTFSIDVDRASYSNIRRFINSRAQPPKDAVRIEELINYFSYELDAPGPRSEHPFSVTTEVSAAPWRPENRLVRVALQGRKVETALLPPANLVFLIDVSGSMQPANKLPLVKQSLRLLVEQLRPQDRVSLAVYAGSAGLVLPPTSAEEKTRIMSAIERLEAGGSTAGGAGLRLAYSVARQSFLPQGNNRVLIATDGDFNIGVSSDAEMERLIEDERKNGIFLSVLGFGMGNYKDSKLEKLADKGNGNYAYIDDLLEARKTLVHEMGGTLMTIAKDVKLQIEFNPARVQAYRLIGYENRLLRNEDFADDSKDAGEMGAGHSVTALYEIVPAGIESSVPIRGLDSLRYQTTTSQTPAANGDELMFVKLRYKAPESETSRLFSHAVRDRVARPSEDFRFASAVAEFGMLLRDSEYKGNASLESVIGRAGASLGRDLNGYRADFLALVHAYGVMLDRGGPER